MTAGIGATALILCGGSTTRFGGEKAHVRVGGRAVIDRVIDVVAPITDRYPGTGPLGGICTGLEAMESELAVAVACDLPFLNGGCCASC